MQMLTEQTFQEAEKKPVKSYPELVQNLKAVGVKSYTVEVNGHQRIINGDGNVKLNFNGNLPNNCADEFSLDETIKAVKRTQQGLTDYPTFLKEIAAAGVHTYVADLSGMRVIYQGKNIDQNYTEAIPSVG
jgi:uncharacterized protein YbcV (DUF1398 family)